MERLRHIARRSGSGSGTAGLRIGLGVQVARREFLNKRLAEGSEALFGGRVGREAQANLGVEPGFEFLDFEALLGKALSLGSTLFALSGVAVGTSDGFVPLGRTLESGIKLEGLGLSQLIFNIPAL